MLCASLTAWADSAYNGETLYGFNTNPTHSVSFEGAYVGQAMMVTYSNVQQLQGCKVTGIAVPNGVATGSATTHDITLFIASGMSDTGGMTSTQTVSGQMDLTRPTEYRIYPLKSPITIGSGTNPFWVGFTCKNDPAVCLPLLTDNKGHNDGQTGGYLGTGSSVSKITWSDKSETIGYCGVRLVVEGGSLATNNVTLSGAKLPLQADPGAEAVVPVSIQNNAWNAVKELTVGYSVNGGTQQSSSVKLDTPLPYNMTADVNVPMQMPAKEQDGAKISYKITGLGSAKNNATSGVSAEGYTLIMDSSKGVQRAMVLEESTGTTCGWCPRGIVGISKLMEVADKGTFIPIAVHTADEMFMMKYQGFSSFCGGMQPASVPNRDKGRFGVIDPSYENLLPIYEFVKPYKSWAAIEITSKKPKGKQLEVTAQVTPAIDLSGKYAMIYVLTEDGIGPYYQMNFFSPMFANGQILEWWDEQPNVVNWTYDHVARGLSDYEGTALPTKMSAGQSYPLTATLTLHDECNLDHCQVIAMVLNQTTGCIENATTLGYNEQSSLEELDAPEAPGLWYDLLGRRVAHPTHGIYIVGGRKIKI